MKFINISSIVINNKNYFIKLIIDWLIDLQYLSSILFSLQNLCAIYKGVSNYFITIGFELYTLIVNN